MSAPEQAGSLCSSSIPFLLATLALLPWLLCLPSLSSTCPLTATRTGEQCSHLSLHSSTASLEQLIKFLTQKLTRAEANIFFLPDRAHQALRHAAIIGPSRECGTRACVRESPALVLCKPPRCMLRASPLRIGIASDLLILHPQRLAHSRQSTRICWWHQLTFLKIFDI